MKKLLVVLFVILSVWAFTETIKVVAWTVGPDNPSFYRFDNLKTAVERLNKMLEAAGSDIRVKLEGFFDTTDWSSYKQKFVFAVKSGKPIDIVCSGHDDIGAWAKAGYIIPMEEYVKKYWDEVYYDVIPSLWESTKYLGTIYGIPQDTEARPFYINKQVLKKLGWSDEEINALPEKIAKGEFTLFDFVKLAKKAVDAGYVKWGLYHRPKKGIDYFQVFTAFGATIYDSEKGVYVFDKAKMKEVFKFFYDITNTWKITPRTIIGTPWSSIHREVTSGNVFAWMGGTWNWAEWKRDWNKSEQELEDLFLVAPFPKATDDGKVNTLSHPIVYMIPKTAKHPELAALIIALATAPELNQRHAVESGHLPIRYQQFVFESTKKDFIMREGAKLLDFSSFIPNDDMFDSFNTIIFQGISQVESGMNPDQVVELLARQLKVTLKDKVVIK